MTGDVAAAGLEQVILLASSLHFQARLSGDYETSETYHVLQNNPAAPLDFPIATSWQTQGPAPDEFMLESHQGVASLAIVAQRIWLNATGNTTLDLGCPFDEVDPRHYVRGSCGDRGTRLTTQGPVTLHADGISSITWTGAQAICRSDCLPDTRAREAFAGPATMVRTLPFVRLLADSGEVEAEGIATILSASGPHLMAIDGSLRLPAISGAACQRIACEPGQAGPTFSAEGNVELHEIDLVNDRFTADLRGVPDALAIDGQARDPNLLGTASVVTGGAFTLAVLAFLFTRHLRSTALDHPRRRVVHDHLNANPGTSLRALARATGMAEGPLRHHLRILVLTGFVASRRHGSRVRFFVGEPEPGWAKSVVLRNRDVQALWEMLAIHPPQSEAAIVRLTAAWAWKRTTTQRRLKSLAEAGAIRQVDGQWAIVRDPTG